MYLRVNYVLITWGFSFHKAALKYQYSPTTVLQYNSSLQLQYHSILPLQYCTKIIVHKAIA